jgi:hypothetical protein
MESNYSDLVANHILTYRDEDIIKEIYPTWEKIVLRIGSSDDRIFEMFLGLYKETLNVNIAYKLFNQYYEDFRFNVDVTISDIIEGDIIGRAYY